MLPSDEQINRFNSSGWPTKVHTTPNLMEDAWEALEEAIVDTELVAQLHSEGKAAADARSSMAKVKKKIKTMLGESSASARVDKWKQLVLDWDNTLLFTNEEPASNNTLLDLISKCHEQVSVLVKRRAPAPQAARADGNGAFRGNLASKSLDDVLKFQREQARRASEEFLVRSSQASSAEMQCHALARLEKMKIQATTGAAVAAH